MNIEDINKTIVELENDSTTFENCQKLASLYIVRQNYLTHLESGGKGIVGEYKDILPQYLKYIDVKRRYQLGEVSEKVVEKHIKLVCKEISEFIHTLYTGTDMPIERDYIRKMLTDLQTL